MHYRSVLRPLRDFKIQIQYIFNVVSQIPDVSWIRLTLNASTFRVGETSRPVRYVLPVHLYASANNVCIECPSTEADGPVGAPVYIREAVGPR